MPQNLILNTTVDGTTVVAVSSPVVISQSTSQSFETLSDGGAAVTVDIQVSNVGDRSAGWVPPRDDATGSTDWVTVLTNTLAAGSATARLDTLMFVAGQVARVKVSRTSGSGVIKVAYSTLAGV